MQFPPTGESELTLIRTLKAMEILLQDVRRILESRRSGVCTCASLQETIRAKAGEIEQKIAALRDLHSELDDLLSRWQDSGLVGIHMPRLRLNDNLIAMS